MTLVLVRVFYWRDGGWYLYALDGTTTDAGEGR
jgi:hypothetical protein